MKLKEYINQTERGEKAKLARFVGVKPPHITFWASGIRQVPAERCPLVEQFTKGKVTCEELRPDVNWAVLRNSGK